VTKILFLASWYPTKRKPYLGIFVQEQAIAIAKQPGYRVYVFAFDYSRQVTRCSVKVRKRGKIIEVIFTVPWVVHKTAFYYFAAFGARWLSRVIQRIDPDTIHAHAMRPAGDLALRLKASYGYKYVVTEHKGLFSEYFKTKWSRKRLARVILNAEKCFAVSNAQKSNILHELGLREASIEILPNPVNTNIFKLVNSGPRKGLLCVANLVKSKRVDWVISAMARAKTKQTLTVVGQGPELENLENLAKKLGIHDQVLFTGAMSRTELASVMNRCKTLVHASQYESFGLVCFEAIACGMDVIVSRCGGIECYLGSEDVTYFSDFDELVHILKEQESSEWSGKVARLRASKVESTFSPDVFGKRLGLIYQAIRK
jgi:glycosyltransferase involved in cell wall biosynthesis